MSHYKIAIVGLGPKGLYAFERLLSGLNAMNRPVNIEIHLFEKTGNFGAGEIYDMSQPNYHIMNYPNRNINVWLNQNPNSFVPETLSFTDWLQKYENNKEENLDYGFSPRRLVGKYLTYCFELLLAYKNDCIKVILHSAKVSDILKDGQQLLLDYKSARSQIITKMMVQEVLLTTGHTSCQGRLEAAENSLDVVHRNFIPFVYPVDEKLGGVLKNSTVGIKGLGLTFIDTVLALTEGRGGKFERMHDGNLLYVPSGDEPKRIIAFSRSGMPMIPRCGREGQKNYRPLYFTVENIRLGAGKNNKINFVKHALPLFIAEMQYRYYSIVFEQQNLSFYPDKDIAVLNKQIQAFHDKFPEIYRLNFADLYKPKPFVPQSLELSPLTYMRYLLKEAEIGSESSPFMAAAMTWGRLSETFNFIYSFGGLTANSHCIFDKNFRSKLNRISYGPPLVNMKKIVSLVEMGIVNFGFAENPEIKKMRSGWAICDSQLKFRRIDTLIDARIPTIGSKNDWSPLLVNMQKSGLLRPFINNDYRSYEVGCPEMNRQGRAIDHNGHVNPNISFYGTPTEGVVYDNDTLSRTRNNFATQWANNIIKNYSTNQIQMKKVNT